MAIHCWAKRFWDMLRGDFHTNLMLFLISEVMDSGKLIMSQGTIDCWQAWIIKIKSEETWLRERIAIAIVSEWLNSNQSVSSNPI